MPHLENSYLTLPSICYAETAPSPVRTPELVVYNQALADEMGFALEGDDALEAEIFAGNRLLEGSHPVALAYAGHQFGGFTMLGDGRAHILGEHVAGGKRFDLQLKGSGRTPFSRNGDGRAVLGPMLREYLISEAMHVLGIPTTRALAVVATGEKVQRERAYPGAVLTRVALGHLRVGSFQYLAASRRHDALKALADYAIARHFPELADADQPYLAFFQSVIAAQAKLVSEWLRVGFIHGVMNTDNMAISGETIDYGPCAFMDEYHPYTVFSSIDRQGRYAYAQQPQMALWNLARLGDALLPLLDADEERAAEIAGEALEGFGAQFSAHWLEMMRGKLGLVGEDAGDQDLIADFLKFMQDHERDYTESFLDLERGALDDAAYQNEGFQRWHQAWQARIGAPEVAHERMRAHNPVYIPRNHRVDAALSSAEAGDMALFNELLAVVQTPYTARAEWAEFEAPPKEGEHILATFCGT